MAVAMCMALIVVTSAVVLPTDTITLSWNHTVEGTPWEEDYAVVNNSLVITQARVKRSGAGMDAPAGAVWNRGWWHYIPSLGPIGEVVLANSSFASGYRICWDGNCRSLNAIVATDDFVKLAPIECVSKSKSMFD